MDIDSFQEEIGGISSYQIWIIVITPWLIFPSGFHTQSSVFLSAVPEHRCSVPPIDDPNYYNLTEDQIKNYTIPYKNGKYESCYRYAYNLSECGGGDDLDCITSNGEVGAIPCDNGYYYDKTYYLQTTISQWDLVCDRQYLDSLVNTLFFLGFFIGSMFIGPLSDWFGRKLAMLVVCIGVLATGVGCVFTPTYELYVFVRILIGAFAITCFIAVYAYVFEISTKKWRTAVGTYVFLLNSFAHAAYPGIAYALRDWHYLQLAISLTPIPFLVIYFFIPESPRWLLSRGKFEEARKVLSRYARSKGKQLEDETWNLIVKGENEKNEIAKQGKTAKKYGVWDLFRRPLMRLLSINVMICWFTVSMVFYGLALNGGNLAGDPYLNNALNGIVEIGGYMCVYLGDPFGRRPVLSTSYTMAGVACISSMIFALYSEGNSGFSTASTALAIIGKLFASAAFGLIYAVTSEIFPTDVRSTGLSMGSMAARVGAMISPFILQSQSVIPWLAQTIFGSFCIIAGFTSMFFPETSNRSYPTSLDDAEEFYRNNMGIVKWFKRRSKDTISLDGKDNHAYPIQDDDAKKGTRL